MEIRRYIETLLIWARAKKDELIYTIFMIIGFSGILIMVFGNYRIGFTVCVIAIFFLLMGIVWNE